MILFCRGQGKKKRLCHSHLIFDKRIHRYDPPWASPCPQSSSGFQEIPSSLLPTSLVAPTHLHCWFSPSPLPFRVSVPRGSQSCILFYFPSMLIFFVTSSGSMALNVIYSHNLRNDICSPELQLVFLIAYLITPTWMSHSQLKQNLSEATPI